MKVVIENSQDRIPVSGETEALIRNVVGQCLKQEGFKIDPEISLLLVDNETIRELNKQYRGKDKSTDVLSFPMVEGKDGVLNPGTADYNREENLLMLGDIVISLEMAEKQAEEFGHSFRRELAFLVTHGVFHLLGYDHETTDDEKTMRAKQEAVLAEIGLKREEV